MDPYQPNSIVECVWGAASWEIVNSGGTQMDSEMHV